MGTGNSNEFICVIELFRNVLTEGVSGTSWRNTPTTALIWVRPEQVAHWAFLWHLLNSIKLFNLIKGVDGWGETTVKAENLILNDCSQWQVVEELSENFPDISISVLSETFVVETIAIETNSLNFIGTYT